jgi:hypothetical protein
MHGTLGNETDDWYWWPDNDYVPSSNCWLFNQTSKARNVPGPVSGPVTFTAVSP